MRAAVVDASRRLVVGHAPKPACPDDGIRVRVEACAVCGTDLKTKLHTVLEVTGQLETKLCLDKKDTPTFILSTDYIFAST